MKIEHSLNLLRSPQPNFFINTVSDILARPITQEVHVLDISEACTELYSTESGNQQRTRQKLRIISACVCELKHIIQPVSRLSQPWVNSKFKENFSGPFS